MRTRRDAVQPVSSPSALPALADEPVARVARRQRRIPLPVWLFLGVLALIVLTAVFAPLLAPYDPAVGALSGRLAKPAFLSGDPTYLLGADGLGRDVLSRMLWGARISLTVGFAAVLVGGLSGSLLGLLAG